MVNEEKSISKVRKRSLHWRSTPSEVWHWRKMSTHAPRRKSRVSGTSACAPPATFPLQPLCPSAPQPLIVGQIKKKRKKNNEEKKRTREFMNRLCATAVNTSIYKILLRNIKSTLIGVFLKCLLCKVSWTLMSMKTLQTTSNPRT